MSNVSVNLIGRFKDLKVFQYLCIDSCVEENIYPGTNMIWQNTAARDIFL